MRVHGTYQPVAEYADRVRPGQRRGEHRHEEGIISTMAVEIIGIVGAKDVLEPGGDPGNSSDPLEDVVDWGRELIPRIRDLAETISVGGSGA